jgi:hypothetical protein
VSGFVPFTLAGKGYSFDHLKPIVLRVSPDNKADTKTLVIRVNFSCHCFTEKHDPSRPELAYYHAGETRSFDEDRYSLSLNLHAIIAAISDRKVFFTRDTNYLFVEALDHRGHNVRYAIFFDLKKARDQDNDLIMTVESAYVKEALPVHLDKIRFRILVGKVAAGHKVRSPEHFQKNRPRRGA